MILRRINIRKWNARCGQWCLLTLLAATIILLTGTHGWATGLISYQGRLLSSGGVPVADGSYPLTFLLYPDSMTLVPFWAEAATVQSTNGLFTHALGSISPLPVNLGSAYRDVYLEVHLNGENVTPRTLLTSSLASLSAAGLAVRDSTDSVTIATDANKGALLFRKPGTGDSAIVLRSDFSGDSAVVLPPDAISSIEILNEAGATWDLAGNVTSLSTGSMTDLAVISVQIPEEGYILLIGKCYVELRGTTGANGAFIQIDENSGGPATFPYYQRVGLSGYVNSGSNYFPVMTTRIYYKTAGEYTFRLEGMATQAPPAVAESWDHILIAQYFPTDISAPFKSLPPDSTKIKNQSGDVRSVEERK